MTNTETYEVFAVRYATRPAMRRDHFVGGDPHDDQMPMDYFVWLIRNDHRTYVVDTGFHADMAKKRQREYVRSPREGLALLGVDSHEVTDVILTHLHYDHVGTFDDFPKAQFHLQDAEMSFATGRHMCNGHYDEHMRSNRFFTLVFKLGDMLNGYRTLHELAASPDHVVPGHDPLVMQYYPAPSPELDGIVVRLDVAPKT